ncbi:hypothetical protein TNCV_2400551 [Trichonephila clavipes]|nr:hypothetical protein TNCV_2400551 [Trichonephila clavipes]
MPDATKYPPSTHGSHGKIVEVEIGDVVVYHPFGKFCRANSYCHLYGAQGLGVLLDPCHDEFRGPGSDCVRQVALSTTTTTQIGLISLGPDIEDDHLHDVQKDLKLMGINRWKAIVTD